MRVAELFKRFMPPDLVRGADDYRRAKLLINIAFIAAAACPVVALSYIGHKHYLAVVFLAISTLCYAVLPFMVRRQVSLRALGHVLCLFAFLMLNSLIATTGGLQSTVLQWLAMVPLFAALTLGRRQMMVWAVVVVVSAGVYYGLALAGVQVMNRIPAHGMMRSEFVAIVALIIVLSLVANIFESGREENVDALKASNDAATKLNTGLIQVKEALESEKSKVELMMRDSEELRQDLALSLENMIEAVQRFSSGDLTVRFEILRDDHIGRLFESFNKAIENIKGLTVRLIETVQSTASSSAQISASTDALSADALEQSERIAKIAAMIDHLALQMGTNAFTASQFAELAKQSAERSKNGSSMVGQVIDGMTSIENVVRKSAQTVQNLGTSSSQIGDIIKVIDEIADQTNLLALNAAIEAARAGEQGRGFAVVADEVRKLAERTTKATKEIAAMIHRIQSETQEAVGTIHQGTDEVARGKALVVQTGAAFEDFMRGAVQSAETYSKIAATSQEQAEEIRELAATIEDINRTVQQSALSSSQIAEAVNDMNRLTERLMKLVSHFRVENVALMQIAKGSAQQPRGNTRTLSGNGSSPALLAERLPR